MKQMDFHKHFTASAIFLRMQFLSLQKKDNYDKPIQEVYMAD